MYRSEAQESLVFFAQLRVIGNPQLQEAVKIDASTEYGKAAQRMMGSL